MSAPSGAVFFRPLIGPEITWSLTGLSLVLPPSLPWKLGHLETWKLDNSVTWKLRNLGIRRLGKLETRKLGKPPPPKKEEIKQIIGEKRKTNNNCFWNFWDPPQKNGRRQKKLRPSKEKEKNLLDRPPKKVDPLQTKFLHCFPSKKEEKRKKKNIYKL